MIQLVSISIINTLVLMAWGKYLHYLDAFTDDKNNEHRLFWFVMAGNIFSMLLVFIIYPLWQSVLPDFKGFRFRMGPFEELSRFIIFISLAGLFKSVKEPRDGVILAASVALGFALGENFLYAFNSGMLELLYRSFFGTLGHMTYSLIWGFTWSAFASIPDREKGSPALVYVVLSLIFTIIFHGVYNALLAYGYPLFALMTSLVTLVMFFAVYGYVRDNSPYIKYPVRSEEPRLNSSHIPLSRMPSSA